MTRTPTERSPCDEWIRAAEEYLADGPPADEAPQRRTALTSLSEHLEICESCRSEIGELMRADRSLEQAFDFLEHSVPGPAPGQIDHILSSVAETPETARLLRRIRRPVNTMLWITVLALSCGALLALAWLVYWIQTAS